MFKVRQFLFLQFSQAVGGTALPPAEHAILAAFMAENPLRNAKRGSINRNFMTREMTSQVERFAFLPTQCNQTAAEFSSAHM